MHPWRDERQLLPKCLGVKHLKHQQKSHDQTSPIFHVIRPPRARSEKKRLAPSTIIRNFGLWQTTPVKPVKITLRLKKPSLVNNAGKTCRWLLQYESFVLFLYLIMVHRVETSSGYKWWRHCGTFEPAAPVANAKGCKACSKLIFFEAVL